MGPAVRTDRSAFPSPCEPGCGWRGGAVWRALLDSARILEEARIAARGLKEALRSEALKMREDATKRRFLATRGGWQGNEMRVCQTDKPKSCLNPGGGRKKTLQKCVVNHLTGVALGSS